MDAGLPETRVPHRNIIVIGGSAGALEALRTILGSLPGELPASVFVALHSSADSPGIVDRILSRAGQLRAEYPEDNEPFGPGRVYVAPPDRHLLLKADHLRVTRGPRENRFRPAIDPLFRTAAVAHRARVIGIILSGSLDDGAVGLAYIKRHRGTAIVQTPEEAVMPSMPQAALRHVKVDHVLTADEIGPALTRLVSEPLTGPEEVLLADELPPDVAEIGGHDIHRPRMLGAAVPFICPECGGTLWESREGELLQYNCHVGHRFSDDSLVSAQTEDLDHALWSALRALEESSALRQRMSDHARQRGMDVIASEYAQQAQESERRAGVIRRVLMPEHDAEEEAAAYAGRQTGERRR